MTHPNFATSQDLDALDAELRAAGVEHERSTAQTVLLEATCPVLAVKPVHPSG